MDIIDQLNKRYELVKKDLDNIRLCGVKVADAQDSESLLELEKAKCSVTYLGEMLSSINDSKYGFVEDTFSVGNLFVRCIDAIESYENMLLKNNNESAVSNASEQIINAREVFAESKTEFEQKYGYSLCSVKDLNNLITDCIERALNSTNESAERMLEDARAICSKEQTVILKLDEPMRTDNELPETILVARKKEKTVKEKILKDIGITGTYKNFCVDLRSQGNVMIKSDFENMSDEKIDEFIIAYIFRYLKSFPTGTVNIHIFDKNTNYLYKRLYNSFRIENAGEGLKKVIQIHSDMNDLLSFRDVYCEDIFRKTSVSRPDLYSIYENDRSDSFNLIVLRDGFLDSSGYATAEILDVVNSLSKPTDTGHKCGLRFLIIDNSKSFETGFSANVSHQVSSIQNNCELSLNYSNGKFEVDGNPVEVLSITDNLDMFIQECSRMIAAAINGKEKSVISLDDVASGKSAEMAGSILFIPVGKSGTEVVELPFSCKDEDGTVAGQCIGYMAIGQSGSGKSSFFHSVVLNGCIKYSPKDLQFWLLDFKNGGASSKYSSCGIPHIRIIAENNKVDDALCLFQMVMEEMERRSNAFNNLGLDNIVDYNKVAVEEGLDYFPRIIIAIDEVQEIFRDDNAAVLQSLISSISSRMRSTGLHFVMVAQNLSEGKSYMLKNSFLPSATGRICFRVAQDIPRDSGFDEEFIQRKQEISDLKTGEAYVSFGKDTIKKVKMAYISPEDMKDRYFEDICMKYPQYAGMKPFVIGSKKRLAISSFLQGKNRSYADEIRSIKEKNEEYSAVIGEDVYRMQPLAVKFSQYENSSLLLLGSDKQIASSLCASVALSLSRQNVRIYLFNGDHIRMKFSDAALPHPFMYVCQNIGSLSDRIHNYRLNQFNDVMKQMYSEYLKRQNEVQMADYEEPVFYPEFLVVNDLYGIEEFVRNDTLTNEDSSSSEEDIISFSSYKIPYGEKSQSENSVGNFRETTQRILSVLLKDGYRFNIHVILAIKGDPSTWRGANIVSDAENICLFNKTEYVSNIENSYYLKEMLKNISNDNEEETIAVWYSNKKKKFSKIRPITYKMNIQEESEAIKKLAAGE